LPDSRFVLTDTAASTSGSFFGSTYTGPVSYLQAAYGYSGTDNVVLGAKVANVFIYAGAGEDALQVVAGSNVLDGGGGSNWLVGASGSDGGTDTFFVDGSGGRDTWDTVLNFHPDDALTLWGYNSTTGSTQWTDNKGTTGYTGATLSANFGNGTGATALVTFAGLSLSSTHFTMSSGSSGGANYLYVERTS
jgi:Ca2+-binding RTX toxin-like protein